MSKELEALERIKQSPTIYVGCRSDIYTRYSFECKKIEAALKALDIIRNNCDVENIIAFCVNNEKERDLLKEVLL